MYVQGLKFGLYQLGTALHKLYSIAYPKSEIDLSFSEIPFLSLLLSSMFY